MNHKNFSFSCTAAGCHSLVADLNGIRLCDRVKIATFPVHLSKKMPYLGGAFLCIMQIDFKKRMFYNKISSI